MDDGARLWVNNALIIDQWRQGAAAEFTSDIYLPGGALPIRLEFVEYKENALIQLTWTMLSGGGGGGGSSIRINTPERQQVPYANDIDNINMTNPILRRASIRRERIDSQKGRLKPWQ